MTDGVPSDACRPYAHCADERLPNCSASLTATSDSGAAAATDNDQGGGTSCAACDDGTAPARVFRAASAYAAAPPGDVEAMQREILAHGPLQVAFFVFDDFMQYQSGIYRRSRAAHGPVGGHAARLVGWGAEGGVDYWIAANSWSPRWGERGFFRIRRGTNECGIESTPAAGLPDLHLTAQ